MLTNILTVFALIGAGCGAVVAWMCALTAINARDELESGLRKLQGLRDDLTAFESRVNKLAGRVYAQTRKPPPVFVDADDSDGFDTDLDPELAAQIELQRRTTQ